MKYKIILIVFLCSSHTAFSQLSIGGGISSLSSRSVVNLIFETFPEKNFGYIISVGMPSFSAGFVFKNTSNIKSVVAVNHDVSTGTFIRFALAKEIKLSQNLFLDAGGGISLLGW